MKILFIFSVLFVVMSCKELGDAIYEPPVIESFELIYDEPILPLDTVTAFVSASNPEKGELSYSWEVSPDRGQFLSPINESSVKWVAPFDGDDYEITAIVKNDKRKTSSKIITVQSLDKPYVRILEPKNNQFFVQGQEIEISATAYHANNLKQVWLLVDNVNVDIKDYNSSDSYVFSYIPDSSKIGTIELKVVAEANTSPAGNTSSDYINISIEGILSKAGNP